MVSDGGKVIADQGAGGIGLQGRLDGMGSECRWDGE